MKPTRPKINDNPNQYVYDLNNASSSTDCTGLIPTPPQSEDEEEAYQAIYQHIVPKIDYQ